MPCLKIVMLTFQIDLSDHFPKFRRFKEGNKACFTADVSIVTA